MGSREFISIAFRAQRATGFMLLLIGAIRQGGFPSSAALAWTDAANM
jgi:hypothetical protein